MIIKDSIFYNIDEIAIDDFSNDAVIEHNNFYNCENTIKINAENIVNIIIQNNIISNTNSAIICNQSKQLEIKNCLLNNSNIESNISINNCIINVDPLFINESISDFRIMKIEKNYPIDSFAKYNTYDNITYPSSGRDIGAYDETITLSEESWDEFIFDDPPKNMNITIKPVNQSSIEDINGNYRRSADDVKLLFSYNFSDYIRRALTFKLKGILIDDKVKKFMPIGGESIMSDCTTGIFTNDKKNPMIELIIPNYHPFTQLTNWYKGFWITINYENKEYDYYIESNKNKTLYLVNKLKNPELNDSIVNFKISYMLVQTISEDISLTVNNFIGFTEGQALDVALGEDRRGIKPYEEYNSYNLKMQEIDDYDI